MTLTPREWTHREYYKERKALCLAEIAEVEKKIAALDAKERGATEKPEPEAAPSPAVAQKAPEEPVKPTPTARKAPARKPGPAAKKPAGDA